MNWLLELLKILPLDVALAAGKAASQPEVMTTFLTEEQLNRWMSRIVMTIGGGIGSIIVVEVFKSWRESRTSPKREIKEFREQQEKENKELRDQTQRIALQISQLAGQISVLAQRPSLSESDVLVIAREEAERLVDRDRRKN